MDGLPAYFCAERIYRVILRESRVDGFKGSGGDSRTTDFKRKVKAIEDFVGCCVALNPNLSLPEMAEASGHKHHSAVHEARRRWEQRDEDDRRDVVKRIRRGCERDWKMDRYMRNGTPSGDSLLTDKQKRSRDYAIAQMIESQKRWGLL